MKNVKYDSQVTNTKIVNANSCDFHCQKLTSDCLMLIHLNNHEKFLVTG